MGFREFLWFFAGICGFFVFFFVVFCGYLWVSMDSYGLFIYFVEFSSWFSRSRWYLSYFVFFFYNFKEIETHRPKYCTFQWQKRRRKAWRHDACRWAATGQAGWSCRSAPAPSWWSGTRRESLSFSNKRDRFALFAPHPAPDRAPFRTSRCFPKCTEPKKRRIATSALNWGYFNRLTSAGKVTNKLST